MNAHTPILSNDPWSYWWNLGYRTLLPIRPNDKVPAVLTESGWVGLKEWPTHYPTESQIDRYRDMGAGIGVRCEKGLLAIDADPLLANLY